MFHHSFFSLHTTNTSVLVVITEEVTAFLMFFSVYTLLFYWAAFFSIVKIYLTTGVILAFTLSLTIYLICQQILLALSLKYDLNLTSCHLSSPLLLHWSQPAMAFDSSSCCYPVPIQSILNTASRAILWKLRLDHLTPLLKEKFLTMTYMALANCSLTSFLSIFLCSRYRDLTPCSNPPGTWQFAMSLHLLFCLEYSSSR